MSEPEPCFVDTNVFLRFLTNDDPAKARQARALFQSAVDGERTLFTSLLVIAEIIWTLESFYGLAKAEIAASVEAILGTPNLECPEVETILQALDLHAEKNIDFIDAYHACFLKERGLRLIATYDRKHFKRIGWLEIVNP